MEKATKQTILAATLTAVITLSSSWLAYAVGQENHEVRIAAVEKENLLLKKEMSNLGGLSTSVQLNAQQIQIHTAEIASLIQESAVMRAENAKLVALGENLTIITSDLTIVVRSLKETTDRLDERSKLMFNKRD